MPASKSSIRNRQRRGICGVVPKGSTRARAFEKFSSGAARRCYTEKLVPATVQAGTTHLPTQTQIAVADAGLRRLPRRPRASRALRPPAPCWDRSACLYHLSAPTGISKRHLGEPLSTLPPVTLKTAIQHNLEPPSPSARTASSAERCRAQTGASLSQGWRGAFGPVPGSQRRSRIAKVRRARVPPPASGAVDSNGQRKTNAIDPSGRSSFDLEASETLERRKVLVIN